MTYAIIGFGSIGQALAKAFARKGIQGSVASRRPAQELAPQATQIGPSVTAVALDEAVSADIVFLCTPFVQQAEVAKALGDWNGKTVVDVTNAFGVPPKDLGGLPSSAAVARGLPGAQLIEGFNHLAAKSLGEDPNVNGGRRVVFLAGDDERAAEPVRALAERLGFAPVWLGGLAEGGALVQARGKAWAPLIFQDLVKFEAV